MDLARDGGGCSDEGLHFAHGFRRFLPRRVSLFCPSCLYLSCVAFLRGRTMSSVWIPFRAIVVCSIFGILYLFRHDSLLNLMVTLPTTSAQVSSHSVNQSGWFPDRGLLARCEWFRSGSWEFALDHLKEGDLVASFCEKWQSRLGIIDSFLGFFLQSRLTVRLLGPFFDAISGFPSIQMPSISSLAQSLTVRSLPHEAIYLASSVTSAARTVPS